MRISKLVLTLFVGSVLAGAVCGITACAEKEPPEPNSNVVLSFVAVTKTVWDAEKTFSSVVNEKDYNLNYKLSLNLNKDNTLKLTGKCQSGSEKSSGGNPGGPGGPGSGGAPNILAEADEEPETPDNTDWTLYDFALNGTWTEEVGWGYTVKIDNTTIKVDYDRTQGRHNFYYYLAPTINNKKSDEVLVQMQAKDADYRKTLASNYQTYHIKESKYVMYGFNDNGGNASKVNIYLMKDGSIASYSARGSEETYSGKGSWSEDTVNHTMTITVDNSVYKSNAYDAAAGYRIDYSSSVTGYISTVADKQSKDLTDSDFEGNLLFTLSGIDANSQKNYTLEFTQKGYAILKDSSGSRVAVCTYNEKDGTYTVTYGENTYTSTQTDGILNITVKFSVTTTDSSGNESTTEYDITLNGNVSVS